MRRLMYDRDEISVSIVEEQVVVVASDSDRGRAWREVWCGPSREAAGVKASLKSAGRRVRVSPMSGGS